MRFGAQIPVADLLPLTLPLPSQGLLADGLHQNAAPSGGCLLTTAGLQYGSNVRNLLALEMLTRVKSVLFDGVDSLGDIAPLAALQGSGTVASPYIIDETVLPFVDSRSTATSSERTIASYAAGCAGASQNEAGPERWYTLRGGTTPQRVRIIALCASPVDVDVHVLTGTTAATCVRRHNYAVHYALAAGETVQIVIDTYVSSGTERSGAYTLLVLRCESDDPDCT